MKLKYLNSLMPAVTIALSLMVLNPVPVIAGIFSDDAVVASRNLSKAADNFEVLRRIVFLNNVTDTYLLEVIGYCSIKHEPGYAMGQLEVTCMTDDDFKKHFLGLNPTTSYFVEQLKPSKVSRSHYRVTFKPQAIIPDVDFRWDAEDFFTNHSEANPQGGEK